jgi:ribosomal protein S18 acetylase RimI-like enzyme
MSEADFRIRDVPLTEMGHCLQFLIADLSVPRAQWVVAQLTDRVERKRMQEIFAVEAVEGSRVCGAAIAVQQPSGAASLLAVRAMSNTADLLATAANENHPVGPTTTSPTEAVAIRDLEGFANEVAVAVMSRLRCRLAAVGTRFLQASSDCEDDVQRLRRLGFDHLAQLAFLVLEADGFEAVHESSAHPDVQFVVVGDDATRLQDVCSIAERTFTGTLDCPRLNQFRSSSEIVDGYRLASTFDPALWRMVTVNGQPAGCLLLTAHRATLAGDIEPDAARAKDTAVPEDATANSTGGNDFGAMEISYMGLVPEVRGQGLGRLVLDEAVRISAQRRAPRMVLAVDRENSPAITLYQRHGWVEAAQESVWGLQIS